MVYSLAIGDTTADGDQYRHYYDLAPRFQNLATNLQDLREDALWSDIGATPATTRRGHRAHTRRHRHIGAVIGIVLLVVVLAWATSCWI